MVGRSRIAACTDVYHEDGRSWSAEAESHIESRKGVGRFSLEIISAIASVVFYFSSMLILSSVRSNVSIFDGEKKHDVNGTALGLPGRRGAGRAEAEAEAEENLPSPRKKKEEARGGG